MTPRQKAEELVSKFRLYTKIIVADAEYIEDTKICALMAVDELIYETHFEVPNIRQRYWIEVKNEIDKL
jgi:hypothetical protein